MLVLSRKAGEEIAVNKEVVRNMIAIRTNLTYEGRGDAPTPTEIRRACEEIQATWSPRERAQRYRGPCATGWNPPMIRLRDLVDALNEERPADPA